MNPDSGYRSRFSHDTEISRPGYYEVLLTDDQIKVQLTATERTGIHKYTYPADQKKQLILDLNHGIYNYDGKVLWANLRVENDTLVTGYRITNRMESRKLYLFCHLVLPSRSPVTDVRTREKFKLSGWFPAFEIWQNSK